MTGMGLHTGRTVTVTVRPAPPDFGIAFRRTDRFNIVTQRAQASNVSETKRGTTLGGGRHGVATIEHLMSALTGLGVDNARIEIDNEEVPILDGSAERYVRAIAPDGLQEQDAERVWLNFAEPFEVRDERTGSWVRVEPAEEMSFEATVDYRSLPHVRVHARARVPGRPRPGQGRRRGQRDRDRRASGLAGTDRQHVCPVRDAAPLRDGVRLSEQHQTPLPG